MNVRCECGRPDWPGSCPGPANCPCVDNRPECVGCGERINDRSRATQDYNADWLCEYCAEEECRMSEDHAP